MDKKKRDIPPQIRELGDENPNELTRALMQVAHCLPNLTVISAENLISMAKRTADSLEDEDE